jgi:hypothetical protein
MVEPKGLKRQVSDTGKALYKAALLAPAPSPKAQLPSAAPQPYSELVRQEVTRHKASIIELVFGGNATKVFNAGDGDGDTLTITVNRSSS